MKKKSIKVNAIWNTIRQCLSILFPLITYPYVSRVLGASNLGRYSFSESVVQILITISIIGIPTYSIREGSRIRDNKDALVDFCSEVFTLNCISVLFSYTLLAILVIFVPRIRLESVSVMVLSINILSKCIGRDWLNSIFEEYLYISIRYIVVHAISLGAIFLLVKKPEDILIYVTIMAFSQLGGNVLNVFYTNKKVPIKFKLSQKTTKHLKPILLLFCSSIATTIYIRSDITILGFMRTNAEVGIYSMSSKIYTIVKSVLNALIMVSIPRLSYYLGNENGYFGRYSLLLNKIRNALVLLLFPAVTGLFCLSKDALYLLGGEEFVSGSISLQILCGALIFAVFGCFYAQGILIANRLESVFFKATVISAIINIVLNFVFIPLIGINGAALTTLISEISIVIMCKKYSHNYYNDSIKKLIANSYAAIIECFFIAVLSYGLKSIIGHNSFRIVLTIIISVVIYVLVLWLTKNEIFITTVNDFIIKLKRKKTS